jgi:hypothetical protein
LLPAVATTDDYTSLGKGGSDYIYRLRRYYENDGIASEVGKNIDRPFD